MPVFAGALLFAYWAAPRMNSAWFYHRDSAQELAAPWWTGPVMTLAMFGCSMVLVACFFAWVPRRRTWFTVLGAGHAVRLSAARLPRQGLRLLGLVRHAWLHTPAGRDHRHVVAAAVITVLCTPPVQRAPLRDGAGDGSGRSARDAQAGAGRPEHDRLIESVVTPRPPVGRAGARLRVLPGRARSGSARPGRRGGPGPRCARGRPP